MHALELSAGELKTLQDADTSLDMPKKAADGHPNSAGAGFMKNELLYRRWNPPGQEDPSMAVEQLVLPLQCRKEVLRLAHNIPSRATWERTRPPAGYSSVSTGQRCIMMLLSTA